jgi:hypothetical protein
VGRQRVLRDQGAASLGKSGGGLAVQLAREQGVSPRRFQGFEPAEVTTYLREDPKHPSWVTRSITVREPEYSDRDRALLLASWDAEHEPRGTHGVPVKEATDPANNPFSTESTGKFVAEPIIDFAQDAIDRAREARRKAMKNPEDDWALVWKVSREDRSSSSPDPR